MPARPGLVGMLHLPPLPGSPTWQGQALAQLAEIAVEDGRVLAEAGFDALLLQNSLDRPTRTRVDAASVAQMTAIAVQVRAACSLPLGINLHKNDGPSAMAVAAAVGAEFVRVKVHTGAVLSAEGLVTGCAPETLALRRRLDAQVEVWADVHELTSRPLAGDDFRAAAIDAADFGAADVLIVTRPTVAEACERIAELRSVLPAVPLVIGGGVDAQTVDMALACSEGVIVGRSLKDDARIGARPRPDLARRFVQAAKG